MQKCFISLNAVKIKVKKELIKQLDNKINTMTEKELFSYLDNKYDYKLTEELKNEKRND